MIMAFFDTSKIFIGDHLTLEQGLIVAGGILFLLLVGPVGDRLINRLTN